MSFHDFTLNEVFTSANADILMRQGIMRFADTSSRDTALSGVLAEGLHTYQDDANTVTYYTGAAWVILSEPTQAWTPTVTHSGSVAKTTNWAWYKRTGDLYEAQCKLSFTGSGTSTNAILVSTPLTQVDASGSFIFYDSSNSFYRVGNVLPNSTTTYSLAIDSGADLYGIAGTDGITNNDVLWLKVTGRY